MDRLKRRWEEFRDAPPGQRFRAQYERRQKRRRHPFLRVLRMLAALCITLAGLVLMPAPGPGMAIVALGLTLLAHESRRVAQALDWAELRLRPLVLRSWRAWQGLPMAAQLWLGLIGALIALAAGLFSLRLLRDV